MQVMLNILTEQGPVLFARFWDMDACGLVLDLLVKDGGTGWCLVGVAV